MDSSVSCYWVHWFFCYPQVGHFKKGVKNEGEKNYCKHGFNNLIQAGQEMFVSVHQLL